MSKFKRELANMLKARFPYIYMTTWEENRAISIVDGVINDSSFFRSSRKVLSWSQNIGVQTPTGAVEKKVNDPMDLLDYISSFEESSVFILKDFHVFLDPKSRLYNYNIIRKLRDISHTMKNGYVSKTIIFVAPTLVLPLELQKDISILDLDFPSSEEIMQVLNKIISDNAGSRIRIELTESDKRLLSEAALGLTLQEAENAFAKSMVDDGVLCVDDLDVVLEEKRQIIRKTGILEYITPNLDLKDVGGLENLKKWLSLRSKAWTPDAKEYNIPWPKGVLLTGVPGCGKSLISKAISTSWNMPLLRLDMGSIFSSLLGSSEENMRKAIKTAEAIAPSILWIDEIEKGFSDAGSNDGGVSTRIFGSFLTWMQEKESPVFVLATANDIQKLPPEFLRKGRFDEIFFVDIPTHRERQQIFKVHVKKKIEAAPIFSVSERFTDDDYNLFSELTEGFVGAEIEQCVVGSLFEGFNESRGIEAKDIEKAIKNIVPLSVTQSEKINALRAWADVRAVSATSSEDAREYQKVEVETKPQEDDSNMFRGGRSLEF